MQESAGAIRDGDYKLLEYFENGTVQLFNLKDDLGEQKNLAAAEPEQTAKLLAKLRAWRKRWAQKCRHRRRSAMIKRLLWCSFLRLACRRRQNNGRTSSSYVWTISAGKTPATWARTLPKDSEYRPLSQAG